MNLRRFRSNARVFIPKRIKTFLSDFSPISLRSIRPVIVCIAAEQVRAWSVDASICAGVPLIVEFVPVQINRVTVSFAGAFFCRVINHNTKQHNEECEGYGVESHNLLADEIDTHYFPSRESF